ncbi:hypothetical protein LguiA_032492 [Lonicera macranthoides]
MWLARDEWVFNRGKPNFYKVVESSLRMCFEFKEASSLQIFSPSAPPNQALRVAFWASQIIPSSWAPMLDGSIIVNCNAAFPEVGAAIACIIQDAACCSVDFFAKRVTAPSAQAAEALAIREGSDRPLGFIPFCVPFGLWLGKVVSALISEEKAAEMNFSATDVFKLTYLEGNSWLWEVGGLRILVDPILVGTLDFGIPWLYNAAKKFLKNFQLSDLPEINCILITQSLDDHCHLKTLRPLSQKLPNVRLIATPNAKELLDPLFNNVIYLEPGQSSEIEASNGSQVKIQATVGPVLGPPWQRPENGYLVSSPQGQLTLYYEPHCVYNKELLEKKRADIVITPVIKQLLPSFTLVSGQEDAVQLAKQLCAKFIVPMKNGDLDSKGLLSSLVKSDGTVESFKELLSKELPDAKVLEPTPGVPLDISAP